MTTYCNQVGRKSGTNHKITVQAFNDIDGEQRDMIIDAMSQLQWTLPDCSAPGVKKEAMKAITNGDVPEVFQEPLDEALSAF